MGLVNSMNMPMDRLEEARLSSNKTVSELATVAGINEAWYHDLESHEFELFQTLTLRGLRDLCRSLSISPAWLMTGSQEFSGDTISVSILKNVLTEYIKSHDLTFAQIEDILGYEIEQSLALSEGILEWNVDLLVAVCDELGLGWVKVLSGLS